jgi:hypothetical protein
LLTEPCQRWLETVTVKLSNTMLKLLTNPFCAGAYVFGRTGTRTTVVDGVSRKTRGHRRGREERIAPGPIPSSRPIGRPEIGDRLVVG